MIARRLAPCHMAVGASPAYLRKHGRPKTVIDLGDHRCLGYTLSHAVGPSSWSFGSNGDIKVPVSGPLRAGNGDALVAAAIAGMGIVYQPTFIVADAVADGRLEILELDHPRSEEHTSELQSLMRISYAVFCLKKKKPIKHNKTQT